MTRPTVRIVVQRLVLDGIDVPPGQADAVVEGLGAELRRLLLDGPATPGWGSAASVRAPGIEPAPGASAAEIGRLVGGAVHAGLDGGRR